MEYPGQAPVSLSMYKSSYMVDYKDFTNFKPYLANSVEQLRAEVQLRQKEFCQPSSQSKNMPMNGPPTFRDSSGTTEDQKPVNSNQQQGPMDPQGQPRILPGNFNPSLDTQQTPADKPRYESKKFPKPLDINYPLPEMGENREPTDTELPSDQKPLPFRWGPAKPYYL
ncbi:protein SPMIP9 isoform X1 [Macrotis lagotis]